MVVSKEMNSPKPKQGAELIIKQNNEVGSAFSQGSGPGVFILGNADGFRWLSEYFAWVADRVNEGAEFVECDPDDHQHLAPGVPFDPELSDEMGLQIGSFSTALRQRVFDGIGLTKERRCSGTSVAQFSKMLDFITQFIENWPLGEEAERLTKDLKALIPQAEECLVKWGMAADERRRKAADEVQRELGL